MNKKNTHTHKKNQLYAATGDLFSFRDTKSLMRDKEGHYTMI